MPCHAVPRRTVHSLYQVMGPRLRCEALSRSAHSPLSNSGESSRQPQMQMQTQCRYRPERDHTVLLLSTGGIGSLVPPARPPITAYGIVYLEGIQRRRLLSRLCHTDTGVHVLVYWGKASPALFSCSAANLPRVASRLKLVPVQSPSLTIVSSHSFFFSLALQPALSRRERETRERTLDTSTAATAYYQSSPVRARGTPSAQYPPGIPLVALELA
ncbi:hypothetical protein F4861DRAFT_200791 [Xylaria intraflava]|nr:hypothetical protein F4861DRAFT_200791 [Xylaria intraflava]